MPIYIIFILTPDRLSPAFPFIPFALARPEVYSVISEHEYITEFRI